MEIVSIPPLLMMAITVYVGLYHLLFYFKVRSELYNLFFSASCLSVAAYDFFSSLLYSSESAIRSAGWQTGQFICIILFTGFMTIYLKNMVEIKDKNELRFIKLIIAVLTIFFFIILFSNSVFNIETPLITHVKFFNIKYVEAEPGAIIMGLYMAFFIIMAWSTYIIVRYSREGLLFLRPILISAILFFITASNDILVGMGVFANIYLLEYGFLCFIIGMAVSVQQKYLDMYITIQQINRTLEGQVKIRTGELIETRDSLEISNREYRILLQVLSHDLTNNLGSILSGIELIEHDESEFSMMKEMIKLSANNALDLINVVRNIRALEDNMLEIISVNVQMALKESISIMHRKISAKDINIEININSSYSVKVERISFINSVINNILSNAIKFSFPGSRILVTAEKHDDKIYLSFIDHGIGISEKDLDDIFNLKKSKSREGTEGETGVGYGMSLINRFVSLYDGKIIVESTEKTSDTVDHGTTVKLILNSAD